MFTSLPGTAMIFLAGLPSMNFTAPSEAAGLSESRMNCQSFPDLLTAAAFCGNIALYFNCFQNSRRINIPCEFSIMI